MQLLQLTGYVSNIIPHLATLTQDERKNQNGNYRIQYIHLTEDNMHNFRNDNNWKITLKVSCLKARDAMRGIYWEAVILGVALVVLFALMSIR